TTETIFVNGEDVITQWTARNTISEPFFGAQTRKVPVVIHGVSVVRTEDGKITRWSDYYDGLTARRTALGAYFTDWFDLYSRPNLWAKPMKFDEQSVSMLQTSEERTTFIGIF